MAFSAQIAALERSAHRDASKPRKAEGVDWTRVRALGESLLVA